MIQPGVPLPVAMGVRPGARVAGVSFVLAVAIGGLPALAGTSKAVGRAAKPCPASVVEGNEVNAGPFQGLVPPEYDVVDGRFSLRVGGMRTATMSSKIPWFVSTKYTVEHQLRIVGRGVHATARRFAYTAQRAGGGPGRGGVFPTIISPPAAGCWHLTFRSGETVGELTVLVRARFVQP